MGKTTAAAAEPVVEEAAAPLDDELVEAAVEDAPVVVLAKAGTSSDPAVHALMAAHYTAVQNGDDEAAQASVAELAELGFEL